MKKVLSLCVIVLAFSSSVAARTQSNNLAPAGSDNGKAEEEKGAKPKESGKSTSDSKKSKDNKHGKSAEPTTAAATPLVAPNSTTAASDAPAKTVTAVPNGTTETPAATTNDENSVNTSGQSLTDIYKVGIGDVLDIRLLNATTRESTLYTVMAGGLLEYPLAGEPVAVGGFTTDEIHEILTSKVKVYENPKIVVSVREYASHNVIVTGLVNDPGSRVLRREAMPLYVVLAEAQPRPEAGRAVIMRSGGRSLTINLSDSAAMTTLVLPGDVITLTAPPPAPPQYFYIGGQVVSPGQKDFHSGMTLTQAVLASGGTTHFAGNKVKISRQGADGRLVTTEYNLKQIQAGKVPDPVLQPGDRLEISRSNW